MSTFRDKFHELGNWHNKISMASIVSKEALSNVDVVNQPPEELKKTIDRVINTIGKIEDYIGGADKVIADLKPYIYDHLGGDTEIPMKKGET